MRYLTHQEGMDLRQFEFPENFRVGSDDDGSRPDWLEAGREIIGGVGNDGDDKNGFRWRAGMDKCTEGIWIWSKPFMRNVRGKKVALKNNEIHASSIDKSPARAFFGIEIVFWNRII